MTVSELRRKGMQILEQGGFSAPGHECDYLISGALDLPLLELHLDPSRSVSKKEQLRLEELFQRRSRHEPAQYLLGKAPFRDLELEVGPAVLIPRPETEELVSIVLTKAPLNAAVLDMGTGSGAIPVALKYERPDLCVTAADLSLEALETAQRNSRKYKTEIEFIHSDLWQALQGRKFDFVTANLPYVSEEEYKQCAPEIFFEPVMALTAPDEGLALMKAMIDELPLHLTPGGSAVFELSHRQNPVICAWGRARGFKAETIRDLEGKDRFVLLTAE